MIHVIINPISGARSDPQAADRRRAMVERAAAERGVEVAVVFTAAQGHARELAAAAVSAAAQSVIVWGGDGTFNEAAAALLGTSIPVGLVPAGSGNGLAGALGLPRDPRLALPLAFDGRARAIDAGRMAGRPFFNVAGVGFDARVASLFNQRGAGARGGWPYFVIGVREGCTYRGLDYSVRLDDRRRSHKALLMAFANGREYGLGARIAPGAKLDDGLLDAIVVEERGIVSRFWDARHLARGTPHLAPRVVTAQVRRALIEAEGEMEFHVDGEPGRAWQKIDVEVLPAALVIKS